MAQRVPSVGVCVGGLVVRVWALLLLVAGAAGHGRLWEPPSRSSMWRLGYNTSINTDDNELSCGGFTNQWIHFGGRCGICGDPYQQRPRDNEHGGKYASGLITRTYPIGGIINVVIDLTANHLGYFEFRICPIDDVTEEEPENCPDRNRLLILNGDSVDYRYHITDPTVNGHVTLKLNLPKNIYCKRCLLQWKYRTGTRWGCDNELRCGKGIGPQEEFYGCSDISIDNVSSTIYRGPSYFTNKNQPITVAQSLGVSKPPLKIDLTQTLDNESVKKNSVVPEQNIPTTTDEFTGYLQRIIMDALVKHYASDVSFSGFHCKAAPAFAANPIVNEWCYQTCPRNKEMCRPSMCTCKTQIHDVPSLGLKKPLVVVKGDDKTQAFKKLGMDKGEFDSFVGRALRAYKNAESQNKDNPIRSPLSEFTAQGIQNTKTNRNYWQTPGRRKIVFLKVQDNKVLPQPYTYQPQKTDLADTQQQLPRKHQYSHGTISSVRVNLPKQSNFKYNKSLNRRTIPARVKLPNQSPRTYTKSLYRKQNVAHSSIPKYKDNGNISNDIFGLQKTVVPQRSEPRTIRCVASLEFSHNKYMNKWCVRNCAFGFCPKSVCTCI